MAEAQHEPPASEAWLFAFNATGPDGAAIVDRIEAASSKEAWSKLEQRGYTAIRLLEDEGTAIRLGSTSTCRLVFTAAEEEAIRKRRGIAARLLGNLLHRNNLTIWVPLLAWLGYSSATRGFPSRGTTLPLALLATFALWYAWATIPSVLYNLALEANAWCRWETVIRWMRWLTKWKRWFSNPMPEHELLFRMATAEAGLGRLEDALARVAPLEHDGSLLAGFYHARLASLYFAAGNFERVALMQHESRKRNPSDTIAIDLAMTLARRLGNIRGAQALLNDVDEAKQPPLAVAFLNLCRGVIELDKADAAKACSHFEQFLDYTRVYAGTPLMKSTVADARAHYALALAALGQTAEAAIHLAAARPLLSARGEHDLLARCDAAMRAPRS